MDSRKNRRRKGARSKCACSTNVRLPTSLDRRRRGRSLESRMFHELLGESTMVVDPTRITGSTRRIRGRCVSFKASRTALHRARAGRRGVKEGRRHPMQLYEFILFAQTLLFPGNEKSHCLNSSGLTAMPNLMFSLTRYMHVNSMTRANAFHRSRTTSLSTSVAPT